MTSADTVIFYDSSFNPQVDRQAEDRCALLSAGAVGLLLAYNDMNRVHRLGQLKQVEIIRLLSENTIDEHIFKVSVQPPHCSTLSLWASSALLFFSLKMAHQKRMLSEALLAEGTFRDKGKSDTDFKDILKALLLFCSSSLRVVAVVVEACSSSGLPGDLRLGARTVASGSGAHDLQVPTTINA